MFVMITKYLAGPGDDRRPLTEFEIVNNSRLPVFDVGVSAWQWGRRRLTWRIRRYDRWMTRDLLVSRVYPMIRPTSRTDADDLPGLPTPGPPGVPPPVMLVFTDGHGRRWVRWHDGRLTKLYPSLYYLADRRALVEAEAEQDKLHGRRRRVGR